MSEPLLKPQTDISRDVDEIQSEMKQQREKEKEAHSKQLDDLVSTVADHLKREEKQNIYDMRETKAVERALGGINRSIDKLLKM